MPRDVALLENTARKPPLGRVLYVTGLDPSLKFGSLEEQILILASASMEQGGIVLPVFRTPLGSHVAAEFRARGVEAQWADLSRFAPATIGHLLRLIRRHKIDIVHWNFYHPINPYVWVLTLLQPGLRFILTDHNSRGMDARGDPVTHSHNRAIRLCKRVLLKRYSKVLCISDFVLSCLENQGTWSNTSRCTYFINTNRFRPDPNERLDMRRRLGVGPGFVVLVVAWLIRPKGVEVALKSLTRLSEETILWVVGDGEEASALRELSRRLSIESRVTFFGWQSDVHKYMQAADCLVVPSLWQEAAGLVILEGLASGLPVIGSAVGAIPEFIGDRKTGFLFPAGDERSLAEILSYLECNSEIRCQIGRRARETAVQRFSPQARLPEHLDLYRTPTRHGSRHRASDSTQ